MDKKVVTMTPKAKPDPAASQNIGAKGIPRMTEDRIATEMAAVRASLDHIREDLKYGRQVMNDQTKALSAINSRLAVLEATEKRNEDMPRAVHENEISTIKATARSEA
ncbi:MAG: hypothetical protein LC676_10610, partial [Loktanella sp.]|nr:hypothetical protein [Loktanella sp.]